MYHCLADLTMKNIAAKTLLLLFQVNGIHMVLYTDLVALYNHVTSGNKYIRPQIDHDTPTNISISLKLLNLQDINAVDGTVSVAALFDVQWRDENLVWTPSDYNNTNYINLPYDKIWRPPLVNANSDGEMEVFGKENTYLQLHSNGYVKWLNGENLKFLCEIDTSFFPMDKQTCNLEIISWGFSEGNITFEAIKEKIDLEFYKCNNEWDLTDTSVCVDNRNIPTIQFRMTFKRNPGFIIATLVLPAMLMALLNICVFFLPPDSGERIGFSVTLLLSVVVFLTIAQGLLPATSTPRLSTMCIVLMINLVMSGMIIVSVIVSLRFYYKPEWEPIPKWIQHILNFELQCLNISSNKIHSASQGTEKKEIEIITSENTDNINWKEVAAFWDRLSFMFYFLNFIAAGTFFLIDVTYSH